MFSCTEIVVLQAEGYANDYTAEPMKIVSSLETSPGGDVAGAFLGVCPYGPKVVRCVARLKDKTSL